MRKIINDFIDLTDYNPSSYGDGAPPFFEYHFQCPKCEKHFFGKRPTECECGFKHFTQEERIEFLENAVTELTQSLNDLSVLVGNLTNHWLGR